MHPAFTHRPQAFSLNPAYTARARRPLGLTTRQEIGRFACAHIHSTALCSGAAQELAAQLVAALAYSLAERKYAIGQTVRTFTLRFLTSATAIRVTWLALCTNGSMTKRLQRACVLACVHVEVAIKKLNC